MNTPRWFYYVVTLFLIGAAAMLLEWRQERFTGKCEVASGPDSTMTVNCIDYRTGELTIKRVH